MKFISQKFHIILQVEFPLEGTAALAPDDCGPQGPQSIETVCFDVLRYSADFELNTIPNAVVSVAMGRSGLNTNFIAEIHRYVDEIKMQLKATVWCFAKQLETSAADAACNPWPAGSFKLFEGYLTGIGFRHGEGGAETTITITHWLTDLNFSSSLTKMSHPQNPAELFYPALHKLRGEGNSYAQPTISHIVDTGLAGAFFDNTTIVGDFWGGLDIFDDDGNRKFNGLKDWFIELTQQDRVNTDEIQNEADPASADFTPAVNWEACRALKRFEPNVKLPGVAQESGYRFGVPIRMGTLGALDANIASSISAEISTESLEGYTNATLWDKLAGQLHSNYMISVVPLVERALVVPFVPGLSSAVDGGNYETLVHRVIYTSQYTSLDLQSQLPRPLRAVGVLIGKNFEANGFLADKRPFDSVGGYYDKYKDSTDPRFREGLIMFKRGPRWLSGIVVKSRYTPSALGINGTLRTSTTPAAGDPVDGNPPVDVINDAITLWDNYARSLYIHEVLKGRQGVLAGPVRFDIAPGSQVMVEATLDKFVKEDLLGVGDSRCLCPNPDIKPFLQFFHATVLRVSTTIDCQNLAASTSFFLAHIRTREENADKATAIDSHPLWSECQWAGCSLIDDPAIGNAVTKAGTDCD